MPTPITPIADRFWAKVDKRGPDECWPWLAYTNRKGYGEMCSGRRGHKVSAHRVAYELLVGPIPEGHVIDHHCENPGCVNPAHMEPVTSGVNVIRGNSIPALNSRKTHCKYGHEFTDENTGWSTWKHYRRRYCRTCRRERVR